jgi:hypothetical protein
LGSADTCSPGRRVIRWSQSEIARFDDDPFVSVSYPDLVEDGGAC